MSLLDEAKQHIFEVVTAIAGNDSLVNDLVVDYPPNPSQGDLTIACFVLAKINGQTPSDLAKDLAAKLSADEIVAEVKAVGPYLNFWLQSDYLNKIVTAALVENYGQSQGPSPERIMIEYSNANTHKEYHVGHLRNICYGDAVARLLSASGFLVDKVSYINDFGIHAAKTLWWIKHEDNPQNIKAKEGNDLWSSDAGYYLGVTYREATQKLIDNNLGNKEVGQIMQNIESRTGEDYKLWQKTRQWSIDYFSEVYRRLKIKFDQTYYESEVIDEGRRLVNKLLERGVLQKSQGAVIADLTADDLGVLVLLRSDGTALYPVADLALAAKKFSKTNLSQSLYVVDVRQSLYFQQLFRLLVLAGFNIKTVHLTYDFVRLPEGMMSSRSGRVITFEEVYETTLNKLRAEITQRHGDWSDKKIETTATIMTVGVLKFEMIKVGADKIITFDLGEALRFDGFTSVYLQYTVARINSLLVKGRAKLSGQLPLTALTEIKERELMITLAKFEEVIRTAGRQFEPSGMAKYLFDLSRAFNDYYQSVPIIQNDPDKQAARLALAAAVKQTLTSGLAVLGIETVAEM